MMKGIISSLAVLAVSSVFAAPSFQAVPAGDEVVVVPNNGDESGSIVDNKKPNGDNSQNCGCNKNKKSKR